MEKEIKYFFEKIAKEFGGEDAGAEKGKVKVQAKRVEVFNDEVTGEL